MKRNAIIAALWGAVFFAMMAALPEQRERWDNEQLTAKQRQHIATDRQCNSCHERG